ncbi:FAD-dependent 5-carboxymethylaminomethyl-2-thiouridine(34) oxidoreductase MnmC [Xylophilus ampelinus]|uniref:tRNA 5-methylaminomethyl-2-thiouridine biosynthesis bifunctional protein MnmC n=1 Tax=Xylophilus ampelinus TaxID=54067 RepID=A0A318SJV4_9BURK|nr:FAD-dependent 5-carboxymethylaminomethyl-2-thiouridine(34) oxidoreductase MnmC [Xylophilus ampelinus]MCS4508727.1 FAD-dependent 5-carboxymethylaminomethyl-2-thiouridine(34) oxidoreductase MnmC [Xylophilus ampelinus]PYE79294.1 tRNA 5-methylaminomethyl-2-thiouridine biosynthesis bifunctional protein [Xylophilus ampelinus]
MTDTVVWSDSGLPRSPRFDDIYHSEAGPTAQARHVFLGGCGLPAAWAGQPRWRILETGFGLGLNFLTAWAAWRDDPARPGLLHFVSVEAWPVAPADLRRAVAQEPSLVPLADLLAARWHGLLPGVHRLAFDGGRVMLTLCVGDVQPMLRGLQRFDADSIFLDGFGPRRNPEMWSPTTLQAVARFARRGTRLATWTIARAVRDALAEQGFTITLAPGLPPKRDCLLALFDPRWEPRRAPLPVGEKVTAPGHCAVVGAGLAGAAVAAALALRGWRVTVLDGADAPAAGASGAPAGVLAPHASPDDALLSRLTRAGVRATWQQLEDRLVLGEDWQDNGVLERHPPDAGRLPAAWTAEGPNETWHASAADCTAAGLPRDTPALLHRRAGWVRPARLIAAWLQTPGVRFVGRSRVDRLIAEGDTWHLLAADGTRLATADRVVLAGGASGAALADDLPLQPVRGQLAWGTVPAAAQGLPRQAINGDGQLIARVPDGAGSTLWVNGATFERTDADETRAEDREANRLRLASLHPAAAAAVAPAHADGTVHDWVGIRCASADRRPLVGPLGAPHLPGVWVCSALGSRGLTFAALCAELLAARWHGEPLPLTAREAQGLDTARTSREDPVSSYPETAQKASESRAQQAE